MSLSPGGMSRRKDNKLIKSIAIPQMNKTFQKIDEAPE